MFKIFLAIFISTLLLSHVPAHAAAPKRIEAQKGAAMKFTTTPDSALLLHFAEQMEALTAQKSKRHKATGAMHVVAGRKRKINALVDHRSAQEDICAICNQTNFEDKTAFNDHVLTEHTKKRQANHIRGRVQCPWPKCLVKVTFGMNLRRHIRLHTGECPYYCTQCNKQFNQDKLLKDHLKTYHRSDDATI